MAFLNLHGLSTFLNELKTNFVNSFNGRKGDVSPTKGDYSIDKISPTSGATEGQIPVLVNNGTEQSPDLEFEMQNVPSGGHAILNPAGTEMTQRDNLQFSGYFTVSDDSTNGKTVVSDEWETITWTDYNALTDQQRAGRHFKITGAPTSALTAGIVSYDNTSSGLSATDVQDAIDELAQGGGAGGHEIIDSEDNIMPQESAMQFADSHVGDDSVNGRTIVENIKEHTTASDYEQATEDGFHVIDDGNDVPIGASSEDKVEVVADGVKTWRQMLNSLYALIDFTKITGDSYLLVTNPNGFDKTLLTCSVLGEEKQFNGISSVNSSHFYIGCARFDSSNSKFFSKDVNNNGTITSTDLSSTVCDNGRKFTLYYGTSSTVINLKTSADYCMMPDGVTSVNDALTWKTVLPLTSFSEGDEQNINLSNYNEYIVCIENGVQQFLYQGVVSLLDTSSMKYQYQGGYGGLNNSRIICVFSLSKSKVTFNILYVNDVKINSVNLTILAR